MKAVKRPNSRRNLDVTIERVCGGTEEALRVRRLMANVIVGQLLPDGAVKGGSALKLRFGQGTTRFSMDLDTARSIALDEYVDKLEAALAGGWEGFTGKLVPKSPAHPDGVPAHYVMQPFEAKIAYNGKSWMTVPIEIGHNEIGDADDPEMVSSPEMAALFTALGFPEPGPVPLMRLEHQIAQKLHAVSEPGSQRAHDLIDLQIIAKGGELDYSKVRRTCVRLFSYRGMQAWPPTIAMGEGWDELYASQAIGIDVLESAELAVEWGNVFISSIDSAV